MTVSGCSLLGTAKLSETSLLTRVVGQVKWTVISIDHVQIRADDGAALFCLFLYKANPSLNVQSILIRVKLQLCIIGTVCTYVRTAQKCTSRDSFQLEHALPFTRATKYGWTITAACLYRICVLPAYQAVYRSKCVLNSIPQLINHPGQEERALKSAILLHQLPEFVILL